MIAQQAIKVSRAPKEANNYFVFLLNHLLKLKLILVENIEGTKLKIVATKIELMCYLHRNNADGKKSWRILSPIVRLIRSLTWERALHVGSNEAITYTIKEAWQQPDSMTRSLVRRGNVANLAWKFAKKWTILHNSAQYYFLLLLLVLMLLLLLNWLDSICTRKLLVIYYVTFKLSFNCPIII